VRMRHAKKALIIGGGVAGPMAAMALGRAGMDPVIYEAYAGGADESGAFLTFASNGLDALRAIDAHHLVSAKGFPTPRMEIQSGTGKHLGDVPNGGTLPDGTVSQTLKRADLYRALRDEALRRGARVEYGKRLVEAGITPDGGVAARFEDGTEAEGDILSGADGIHSRTRRIIDPSAPGARYIPVLNIGGYTSDVRVPAESGKFRMVFGKRAFFGFHDRPFALAQPVCGRSQPRQFLGSRRFDDDHRLVPAVWTWLSPRRETSLSDAVGGFLRGSAVSRSPGDAFVLRLRGSWRLDGRAHCLEHSLHGFFPAQSTLSFE
jgi:2-polyprenyl-6-methoxyphenol hydroxylase-like FAD-dependent oxidoreductase